MALPKQAQHPCQGQGEDRHMDDMAHMQTAEELLLTGIEAKASSVPLEKTPRPLLFKGFM